MKRLLDPNNRKSVVSSRLSVAQGGTDATTVEQARTNLGMLQSTVMGQPNGLLVYGGEITADMFDGQTLRAETVTLSGPTEVDLTSTSTYTITNYDMAKDYTTTTSSGTVSRVKDTITLTLGVSAPQVVFLRVADVVFRITATNIYIVKPKILTPVSGANVRNSGFSITTSAFVVGSSASPHAASRLQVSYQDDFLNIAYDSGLVATATSFFTTSFNVDVPVYARVMMTNQAGNESSWSDISMFHSMNITPLNEQAKVTSQITNLAYYAGSLAVSGLGTYQAALRQHDNNVEFYKKAALGMSFLGVVDVGTGTTPGNIAGAKMAFPATSEDRLVMGILNSSLNTSNSGLLVFASRAGDVWTKEGQIQATTRITNGRLGTAVFMDATGTRVYATSPGHTVSSAAVGGIYEFTRSGTAWSQNRITPSPQITAGDGSFGRSLAVNSTGLLMVTGEHGRDTGNVYVWTRTSVAGAWTLRQTITRPAGETSTQFGREVAISKNGNTLIILAAAANRKAYYYKANTSWTAANLTYTYSSTLTTTHDTVSMSMDGVGTLLAISVLVGLNTQLSNTNNTGALNVFQIVPSTGEWSVASSMMPARTRKTAAITIPSGGAITKVQYASGETATPPSASTTMNLSLTETSVIFTGKGSDATRSETLGSWTANLTSFNGAYSTLGSITAFGKYNAAGQYTFENASNSPSNGPGWVRQGSVSVREGLYGVTTYIINVSDNRWAIGSTAIWEGTLSQTAAPVVTWTPGGNVTIIVEGVTFPLFGGNQTTPVQPPMTTQPIDLTRNGSYGANVMIADNGLLMVASASEEYLPGNARGSFYVYGA